jgi:polar amino acid transport system substrate-binding protein
MSSVTRREVLKAIGVATMISAFSDASEAAAQETPKNSTKDISPMQADPLTIAALAPTGKLRASINLGNPVLANKDSATGQPVGVSVDLARAFAKLLNVDIELLVFDAALKSVDAVATEQADIGFFAIDPLRGESIAFTAPYVLINGNYLVPADSSIRSNDEVDRPGNRVAVGKGSAYDLYLTRELRHAQLVRVTTSQAVVDAFIDQRLEVAAGVKQQLEADAARVPNVRLLPDSFMVIQQAMGLPRNRGEAAAAMLRQFVEDMKSSGFVARSLARHGIKGASVAPGVQGSPDQGARSIK